MTATTLVQLKAVSSQLRSALTVKTQVLGQQVAREVTKVLEFGLDVTDIDDLSGRLEGIVRENEDVAFALLADGSGVIASHSDASLEGSPVDREILDPASPPEKMAQREAVHQGGDRREWMEEAGAALRDWRVRGLAWFQVKKEQDWRLRAGEVRLLGLHDRSRPGRSSPLEWMDSLRSPAASAVRSSRPNRFRGKAE